jgi:hypothetical protein
VLRRVIVLVMLVQWTVSGSSAAILTPGAPGVNSFFPVLPAKFAYLLSF